MRNARECREFRSLGENPRPEGFRTTSIRVLVEAAGVEPASEGVTGKATPCSASSWFSSRRLEKRQNSGGATPNWFRRSVRGSGPATPAFGVGVRNAAGALPGHRHCALITQRERDCCYWQLSFFTFFTRWVRPRHATFRVLVPVEAVSPPGLSPRSIDSKIRIDGNTRGGDIFRAAAELQLSGSSTLFSLFLTAKG